LRGGNDLQEADAVVCRENLIKISTCYRQTWKVTIGCIAGQPLDVGERAKREVPRIAIVESYVHSGVDDPCAGSECGESGRG
jgi:hypothetical protein